MDALIKAAKAEGTLNVITLDPTWANYGEIMSEFQAKYGIKINDENPTGGSGDEYTAIVNGKGQSSAPDVVDIGHSYSLQGVQQGGIWAAYKVASWNDIPANRKDAGGLWYSSYGGYVSIGCDASKLGGTPCPTTIKQLDNPKFKGMVALNDSPLKANAAFMAVWAAARANGGSATNIQPGIDFFHKLSTEGIFNKAKGTAATVQAGTSPIILDWDYLTPVKGAGVKDWKVTIPSDGLVSAYYDQAINFNAPHPAAARLWEEFLYSQEANAGQNLWMAGLARPVELQAMLTNGSANKTTYAKLVSVTDPNPFVPTDAQVTAAKQLITQKWAAAVQ